jgi:glycosyltransferase involved in cell wall biosynthesis
VLRVSRKICSELHAIPPDLEEVGIAKPEPPDSRDPDRPSMAIWTGQTAEPWDYDAARTGIGGSEKMVILLAPRLQRRGWNVTVYANMTHERRGVDPQSGVLWRHWAEYDSSRPRDVLVVWRAPQALTMLQGPVKKRAFWGHDVLRPELFTPDVRAICDLFQVQSKFHALPLRNVVPDDQIWVARNGIVPLDAYPQEKDPFTVVYSSSPDRGLLTAAQIVQRAQLTEPKIKLVCCYGMTPLYRKCKAENQHGHIPDMGRDVNADMYEDWLNQALDDVGAVCLNRVGFSQVTRMFEKGGVWLYPTRFPEISCMSAMEAMSAGCVPVCTPTGALAETLTRGGGGAFKDLWLRDCDVKAGAEKLLAAVQVASDDPRRVSMAATANTEFDVETLADEWSERLSVGAPK